MGDFPTWSRFIELVWTVLLREQIWQNPVITFILRRMGGVAERSKAAVLKTVDPSGSGGSNPSSSANLMKASSL